MEGENEATRGSRRGVSRLRRTVRRGGPNSVIDHEGFMMKQLALASALLFAFALAGCGGKAERLSSHLQRSKEYLQQLEYEKASVEIRNVLQIDPKHAEAYFVAGQIEEGRQAYQRAFVNYTRALELDHGRLDAKIRLARLYLAGGQPSKAAELVAEVLAARPDDPGA